MCRASIGCGRPMISATLWFLIVVESLEWPTPCGQRNAEVCERHGSGCNAVGCRSNQTGGCATDVRKWCVYMMRAFGKW